MSQANVVESMGWMSSQLALLSHFHSELEKPNPLIDLEQKLLATKASTEKQIQAVIKERDSLKASQAVLRKEISTGTSNFNQLKLDNTKISNERKEFQVSLAKAQEEVSAIRLDNSHLSRALDHQTADKAAFEAKNDRLKGKVQEQAQLILGGAYMAFSGCLK
jgi:chromosome segregation ATPase